MGAGFGTQSFEQQEGKKVEEQKIEEVRLSKEEPATDFFSGLSAPAEEAPISLHELRMQQEEDNGYVSLPKPSNDSAYFSNSFSQGGEKEKKEESEIPPVSVNSFSEEQKEEKESADDFASFSSDWLTKGRTDDKAAENSIDFELEHTSFQSGEKIERGGFKSFRDFESEF